MLKGVGQQCLQRIKRRPSQPVIQEQRPLIREITNDASRRASHKLPATRIRPIRIYGI